MNSRQLHIFIQIAEIGNLRKAATRLRIAQPALSRYLRALEDELGVRLLDRHPHGVSVTAAGARLLERGRRIIAEIEEVRSEIMAVGDHLAGRVTVGASNTVSRFLFARLTDRINTEYPGIILDLVEGSYYQLLEGLDARRFDFAVMVDIEPRSTLVLTPLAADTLHVFARPGDELCRGQGIDIADLKPLSLIALRRPGGPRMMLERAAAAANAALTIAYELDSPGVIKAYVGQGLGYGVLPGSALAGDLAAGSFVSSAIRGIRLTRLLVRRADQPESPATKVVEQAVRDEFATLCAEGLFEEPAEAA